MLIKTSAFAQGSDAAYHKLLKRYGNVTPWCNGYIIKANNVYAFADTNGKLASQFIYKTVDTVLPDRAIACIDTNGRSCDLVCADGKALSPGSYRSYRLANASKRIFATRYISSGGEALIDDNERQITYQQFDQASTEESLVRAQITADRANTQGLLTYTGEVVLPLKYNSTAFGKKLYAGMRNDTVFVFKLGKGLLFSLAGVHECKILHNDFIVVKKFGMYALVSSSGKFLTGFDYRDIEEFRYPMSGVTGKEERIWAVAPNYVIVGHDKPKGLIDNAGHEILPLIYDNISMNDNGWFILQKAGHNYEELVDPKLKPVLQSKSPGFTFSGSRFVTITERDPNSGNEKITTYDMQLRKFVPNPAIPSFLSEKPAAARVNPAPGRDYSELPEKGYSRDSISVNRARTMLLHSNGYWGVRSITGDTIIPFIYDTVVRYAYPALFCVGKEGKFAVLNYEGEMIAPPILPDRPMRIASDSVVVMYDRKAYSYKGGRLRKIDPDMEPVNDGTVRFGEAGMADISDGNSAMKPGIYNRRLHRIAERSSNRQFRADIRRTGIAAVSDTSGKMITVIDSDGKRLIPWTQKQKLVLIFDYCAVSVGDVGQPDILFRFENGNTITDTVRLDSTWKRIKLYGTRFNEYNRYDDDLGQGLAFDKPLFGKGAFFGRTGKAILIEGTEQLIPGYLTHLKINGRWSLYNWNGEEVIPPTYDSISAIGYYYAYIFKHGKVGIYDLARKKTIEPAFDTIYNLNSLHNHFFIAHSNGEAAFIDDNGKVISSGWKNIPCRSFDILCGIPATKNGVGYKLYPSVNVGLKAVPDNRLPGDVAPAEVHDDGTAITRKNGKYGVYDVSKKSWLIPPQYALINKVDNYAADYFVGYSSTPEPSTSILRADGKKMFTIEGNYRPQGENAFRQWPMRGWHTTPVVNAGGKMIVPDTFKNAFSIETSGRALYNAVTRSGKHAIFDTSGKMLIPAILDDVEDQQSMYNGYFTASRDRLLCLINPTGKMLTPCIYDEIFVGLDWETHNRSLGFGGGRSTYFAVDAPKPAKSHPYFIVIKKDTALFGIIDSVGKTIIPCSYDSIIQIHGDTVAVAKKGTKWGIITLKNAAVTGFIYDWIGIFYEGIATFSRKDGMGTLTQNGIEKINTK